MCSIVERKKITIPPVRCVLRNCIQPQSILFIIFNNGLQWCVRMIKILKWLGFSLVFLFIFFYFFSKHVIYVTLVLVNNQPKIRQERNVQFCDKTVYFRLYFIFFREHCVCTVASYCFGIFYFENNNPWATIIFHKTERITCDNKIKNNEHDSFQFLFFIPLPRIVQ